EIAAALGVSGRTSTPAGDRSEPIAEAATRRFATLDEAVRRHIETVLAETRGRIEGPSGAAAILGVNPHTLRSRMRKLGIDWNRFRGRGEPRRGRMPRLRARRWRGMCPRIIDSRPAPSNELVLIGIRRCRRAAGKSQLSEDVAYVALHGAL